MKFNPEIEISIASYYKHRPEVIAVYLFGSYAQGKEKAFSDIDLGVLLDYKAFDRKDDLVTTYSIDLSKKLRKDFHIVIMNAAGEMLLFQIFKRGKCIFQRKSHSLSLFKTTSYSRIADFGFFRESMRDSIYIKNFRCPKMIDRHLIVSKTDKVEHCLKRIFEQTQRALLNCAVRTPSGIQQGERIPRKLVVARRRSRSAGLRG